MELIVMIIPLFKVFFLIWEIFKYLKVKEASKKEMAFEAVALFLCVGKNETCHVYQHFLTKLLVQGHFLPKTT